MTVFMKKSPSVGWLACRIVVTKPTRTPLGRREPCIAGANSALPTRTLYSRRETCFVDANPALSTRTLLGRRETCIYFSNHDHSVARIWPRRFIKLDSMEFYWDVFIPSFFLSLLFAVFLFGSCVTIVLLYRRCAQVYQSNRKVKHLLAATNTLKHLINLKNARLPNSDVCSICLVRLFNSSTPLRIHRYL